MSERSDVVAKVSEQLVRFRSEEGLSVEEAAEEADIDYERLAAAEAGDLALTEDELQNLAEAYGIEITQFFGGEVTPVEYLLGGF